MSFAKKKIAVNLSHVMAYPLWHALYMLRNVVGVIESHKKVKISPSVSAR
jgi:hypothetical protein